MAQEQNNEWFITDDDCLQCCRPCPEIGPNVFELTQINSFDGHVDGIPFFQVAHGHIYLDDYTKEEELAAIASYGYDFRFGEHDDGHPELSDDEYNQLLAEMYFEKEVLEYTCKECETWNKAVDEIQKITGLELSEYKEKVKLPLDQKIQAAAQKQQVQEQKEPILSAPER